MSKLYKQLLPGPALPVKKNLNYDRMLSTKRKLMLILVLASLITTVYIFYFDGIMVLRNTSVHFVLVMNSAKSVFADFNVNLDSDDDTDIETDFEYSSSENITCELPHLNAFHGSILKYYKQDNKTVNCSANREYPLLFTTDFESNLITVQEPGKFGLKDCCYKPFERKSEDGIRYGKTCFPINETKIQIQSPHEFITIFCYNATRNNTKQSMDMFNFIHTQPNMTNPAKFDPDSDVQDEPNLNVVILGLDAVSHMNFQRTMQKSYDYLVNELKAISLNGYTKVGDNTFPNIVPVFMGVTVKEMTCWNSNKNGNFDSCPFLWKNYSSNGYLTAYAEDATWMGIFSYVKKGFENPPTDYYLRTLTHAMDDEMGHKKSMNANICYGARLGFSVLLNNMKKMAAAMDRSRQKYFQFTWATSLFHDDLNYPRFGDQDLLQTLQWFRDGNYTENTILILMSDHGIRWGDIRSTFQGRIEERMPFLYFVTPTWFSGKYSKAMQNLAYNSDKLTSPFDLYETLKDLLDLKSLDNEQIGSREDDLLEDELPPRGISLFLPIPVDRNCSTADIAEHWCVCQTMEPISNDTTIVTRAAYELVSLFNTEVLQKHKKCAKLELDHIINAQRLNPVDSFTTIDADLKDTKTKTKIKAGGEGTVLTLTFQTRPGAGIFEVTTILKKDKKVKKPAWSIAGDVSRINLYGNDSLCVADYNVKKYCFCI